MMPEVIRLPTHYLLGHGIDRWATKSPRDVRGAFIQTRKYADALSFQLRGQCISSFLGKIHFLQIGWRFVGGIRRPHF